MAFPVVAATSSGSSGFGVSSVTPTYPAGITAGDRCILFVERGSGSVSVTTPTGWTNITAGVTATAYQLYTYWRDYVAGDANPVVTGSGGTIWAWRMLRVTGHEPGSAPEASALIQGSSTTPDPPVLDPAGWGAEDTLWLAACAAGGTAAPSAYPASYTGGLSAQNANGGICAYAQRNLNAASDDPGAFTITTSQVWSAATIAIRPQQAHVGVATLAAQSVLTATAFLIQPVTAQLTAGAALTSGAELPAAAAALAATASLTPSAQLPGAQTTLAASPSLTATVTYGAQAAATLSAASVLQAQSLPPTTMAAQAQLVTSGLLLPGQLAAVLGAQSSLQVIGFGYIPVSATLAATPTLGSEPYSLWAGLASLTAASSLTAGATLPQASATLTAIARLDVSGPFLVTGGTDLVVLAVTSILSATAGVFRPALVSPVGPVRRMLRVPQYRLYAADTRSGRVGWELPFSELSWNTPINEVGTLRASLVIEDSLDRLSDQGARDPRTVFREVLTGPYRFSLVLAWGDQVVFAGPYLPSTNPGDRPTVDVGAGELMRLMDKRVLCDPGETFTLGPTSSGGIIKGLIDRATANKPPDIWWRQGRELPITCAHPPSTSGSLTRSYFGYDTVKAADALASHASEEDAPDYRLDPYLVTGEDGLYVRWELRIGDPTLGAAYDPWVFDDAHAVISQDIDAGRMASMWFVPGSGQDEKKLMAWWVNMSVVNQGFPALEEVESSNSSETSRSALDAVARSTLARYVKPVDQWTVRTPADSLPELGSYRVGDAMAVDIRRHPVIEPGVYTRRITEITGDATPWVSLTSSVKA